MENILIPLMLGIAIVLLIVLIILQLSKKNDNSVKELSGELKQLEKNMNSMEQRVSEQFSINRREAGEQQKQLRENTEKQLNAVNEKMQQLILDNAKQQGEIKDSVNNRLLEIQKLNERKLDQMRETVDEKLSKTLTQRLDSSFKTVSEQLENVYKSLGEVKTLSGGVTEHMNNLNRVLTNVKARGTWAEIQLGNILDQTIPNMYDVNVETVPKSGERVEFAVKVPNEDDTVVYLPLDSKFPMEDYIRLMDAVDNGDKEQIAVSRKALERSVEEQAKRVAKYINVPGTTPFAILYLATEGLYAEIASSKNGIMEKLQNKYRIMLAGPSTITALLNSMSMGFKTIAINKKANDIAKALAAAKTQYGKFEDLLDAAFKRVEDAGKKINEARHRNELINKKLKKFEDLEDSEAVNLLGINNEE